MKNQNPESFRPYLFTVAYNILGEVQEAEDIVQEAFAYYLSLHEDHVQNEKSYLTRVVANKAIDRLKALKKQRELYPGTWLPEPYVHGEGIEETDDNGIMSFEVLSALESLNPMERAIFVLREAFDYPFSDLSNICNTSEANCRKILSRTRKKVSANQIEQSNPKKQLITLMGAFLQALVEEDTTKLESILKEDIVLYSDGGGKVAAALKPLYGFDAVSKFLIGITKKNKDRPITINFIHVNQKPALLLSTPDGPETVISFSKDSNLLSKIFFQRNPDKLLSKKLSQKV